MLSTRRFHSEIKHLMGVVTKLGLSGGNSSVDGVIFDGQPNSSIPQSLGIQLPKIMPKIVKTKKVRIRKSSKVRKGSKVFWKKEIEELKTDKRKFRKLCFQIDEYESKHKVRKETEKKILNRNIILVSRGDFRSKKKRKERMDRQKRETRSQIASKFVKLKSEKLFEMRKTVENQMTLRIKKSDGRRRDIYLCKQNVSRKRKWEFLISLVSRIAVFRKKLLQHRRKRNFQERKENLRKVAVDLFLPFVQNLRREKARKMWRLYKNYFGFAWLYIRFLKKKEAVGLVKRFLTDHKRANQIKYVYLKFTHNVRVAQHAIRQYLQFVEVRKMMGLLQFRVSALRGLLNKKKRKLLLDSDHSKEVVKAEDTKEAKSSITSPSRVVMKYSKDFEQLTRRFSFVETSQRKFVRPKLERSRSFLDLNAVVPLQRFAFVLPTLDIVSGYVTKKIKGDMKTFVQKGIEHLEFNSKQETCRFVMIDEPQMRFIFGRNEVELIVRNSFKKIKKIEKRRNREIQTKNLRTVMEFKKINDEYRGGVAALDKKLLRLFGNNLFCQYAVLFLKVERLLEKKLK